MSAKSTKKSSSNKFRFRFRDERLRKITGLFFILLSFYLGIAFISYLYSWKYDQDKVLHFTWSSFFEPGLTVKNWLGRLGAYVSNMFFYYGFGLPSLLFVMLFMKLGIDLIAGRSLKPFLILARNSIATIAFLSVLLRFMFSKSEFSWGGAFGESTCFWLSNFLGVIGLFLLLTTSLIMFFVWKFNPSFESLSDISIPRGLPRLTGFKIKLPFMRFFRTAEDKSFDESSEIFEKETKSGCKETLKPSHQWELNRTIPKTGAPAGAKSENSSLDLSVTSAGAFSSSEQNEPSNNGIQVEIAETSGNDGEQAGEPEIYRVVDPDSQVENKAELIDVTTDANESQKAIGPYDPTLDLKQYVPPSLELLKVYENENIEIDRSELEANKDQIISTLLNYKIEIVKIRATIGPTVTLYEIVPAPGVKISKIKNLEDDIALSLAALGIRIIAPIPGKGTIGIEVPNKKKQIVSLREVLASEKFQSNTMALPIALGKTISNEVFVADLAKMPHLLIAGATGQGKSVGINTVLMSLLYKKHPSEVKLVLIDPKKVELFPYAALEQHFLSFLPNEDEPIVTETSKVVYTLNSLCIEMDQRYDLLKAAKARNLQEYNEKFIARKLNPKDGHKFLPYIVLVIDEFADLIMTAGKEVELPIARLAQLARAIGIHLIIATQRPSVNIITGVIKANFPARLAFKVTSKIDSRTILDAGGAEQLIGRGDMLLSVGSSVVRLQCAFVDTPEVENVIKFISDQQGFPEPFYLPEFKGDEDSGMAGDISLSELDSMFEDAAKLIVSSQHGSTSLIQRKMQLGYNRAGRIMDQMEKLGIVGPAQGSKPREVLFYSVEELENFLQTLR